MTETAEWRSWDKVSPARTGQANDRRYTGERIEGTAAVECWWCRKLSTRFCDTQLRERIDYEIDGRTYSRLGYYTGYETCDAAMCEEHAHQLSVIHFSGALEFDDRGEPVRNGSSADTIDACPYCQAHAGQRSHRRRGTWKETDYIGAPDWRERVRRHAEARKKT